jgi:hypothetical protein
VAKEIPYEWTNVERIVAIGDIHGAYDNLVAVLKNTGLVDDKLKWIGGKAHLVQLGDVVDRGARSRACMDLLMKLERDAKKKGGRVHPLIGNHEVMNIVGILDHTSIEELASYDDRKARKVRERAFRIYRKEQKQEAKKQSSAQEIKTAFDTTYPPGYFGHRVAFGSSGRYGKWIRGHNVAVRIDGIVFSHGDWSVEISGLGIEEVNKRVRDELSGEVPIEDGITFHLKGPLQYRGLSEVLLTRQQQEARQAIVDRTLTNLAATRMVVGHTATDGVIEPRFGGKHISTDVGMLELYRGGHQVALEIEGNVFRAIHPGGAVELPDYLDESTQFDYLVAVAAVDTANVNVYDRLASEYRIRGNLEGARLAIEQLFHIDISQPFRYRRTLGDIYREMGEVQKGREQDILFIAGMQKLIQNTPDNPHLENVLARFCIERNLELSLAEESIRAALEVEPENPGFLLTSGRMHYALSQYKDAIQALERVVDMGKADYEAYYFLGLSFLGLDDAAGARRFLEIANQKNPERGEAQDALRALGELRSPPQGERKKP